MSDIRSSLLSRTDGMRSPSPPGSPTNRSVTSDPTFEEEYAAHPPQATMQLENALTRLNYLLRAEGDLSSSDVDLASETKKILREIDTNLEGAKFEMGRAKSSGTKTLNEAEWETLVNRLYSSMERHKQTIASAQQAVISAELAKLTFSPAINAKSRAMVGSRTTPLGDRAAAIEERRKARLNNERALLLQKEQSKASFSPIINRASRAATSRLHDNPAERRLESHRRAVMERDAAEAKEFSFTPQINQKSKEMVGRGRALHMALESSRPSSPGRSSAKAVSIASKDEVFRPIINNKSREIVSKKRDAQIPVHRRLYYDSLSRHDHGSSSFHQVVDRPQVSFMTESLKHSSRETQEGE